jgi:hypothetical protein
MLMLRAVRRVVSLSAAAGVALGAPAGAQGGSAPATLDALAGCRKILADAARLACFDVAAARIDSARSAGDLLALDREEVIARKRRQFGLADAARQPLGGGEADRLTEVREVHTTITAVRPTSYARFAVQLANGMVWETIEPLSFAPAVGTAITIRQSGLGGFKASIAGERPVLVKRQR